MVTELLPADAAHRARNLALVLSDNDGVLTDGTVFISERGEELKQYSHRDGMGVALLREAGVATAIITRESSEFARRRSEKLGLEHCWLGVRDKRAELPRMLQTAGVSIERVAYIGDDINDLPIIEAIAGSGLTAAPADAMPEVKRAVHYVTSLRGGRGAFREFAEWLLSLRNAKLTGGAQ